MDAQREIQALLGALAQSPENLPLRRHLAEVYLAHGRTAEAVDCLKEALRLAPGDEGLKRALAEAYRRDGKPSAALVIAEDLIKHGATVLLHGRSARELETLYQELRGVGARHAGTTQRAPTHHHANQTSHGSSSCYGLPAAAGLAARRAIIAGHSWSGRPCGR